MQRYENLRNSLDLNYESPALTAELQAHFPTIAVGILIGKINSPKWDNRVEVAKFINSHYKAHVLAEGREPLPERDPIELRFLLDDRCLVYWTDTDEIKEEALTAKELDELPNQTWRRENQSLIQEGFALGAPVAAFLTKVHLPITNKVAVIGVCGVTVLVSGGLLGYYISYDPNPDYSSKPFQAKRSDKARWRQLALDYRTKKASQGQNRATPSTTP